MGTSEGAEAELARALAERYPADAARAVESYEPAAVGDLLAELPAAAAAAVLESMAAGPARSAAATMAAPALGAILGRLAAPRAAVLIRGVEPARLDAVLAAMPARARDSVRRVLAYAPGTVGAIADPEPPAMPGDATVRESCALVRGGSIHGDRVYVVDDTGALIGVIGAAELIAAEDERRLDDVMVEPVVSIDVDDDVFAAAGHAGWSRWRTLPVTERGVLVGLLRLAELQRLVAAEPPSEGSPFSLPLELAELFWLGLSGVTDGLARAVLAERGEVEDEARG